MWSYNLDLKNIKLAVVKVVVSNSCKLRTYGAKTFQNLWVLCKNF